MLKEDVCGEQKWNKRISKHQRDANDVCLMETRSVAHQSRTAQSVCPSLKNVTDAPWNVDPLGLKVAVGT